MGTTADISRRRFGKWLAIAQVVSKVSGGKRRATWLCRCDCGAEREIMAQSLKDGSSKSCGCDLLRLRAETRGSHGMSRTNLHRRWRGMRQRCASDGDPQYGGRGIRVCPEWDDFRTFATWSVENGYRQDLEIDRIEVNGPYSPSNCRWVPGRVNRCNKQDSHRVNFNGQDIALAELCLRVGMHPETVWRRITRQGLSLEEALAKPAYRFRREHNGGRCLHGHEMTKENTYFPPGRNKWAACRECTRIRNKAAKAKRRAAIETCTSP